MTTLEQAAQAVNYWLELTVPYPDGEPPSPKVQRKLQDIIQDALRTREAETWEQAELVVTFADCCGCGECNVKLVKALRARAAQPQEPTTKVGDR